MGDAVRLAQVVENLLTNAVKYTNPGGQIALSHDADDEKVRLAVRDNGVGMSGELLPHVFEVFTQAPRPLDRAKGGLGLGLPLVRRLIEMHGGQVTAASPGPGGGSEFVLLAKLLETFGHQTLAVRDGPAALEAVRTFHPEVVLLDLGLPGMDGYEVARRLREERPSLAQAAEHGGALGLT